MLKTNVVKGYKVIEQDWTCKGKQYNLGKVAYVRKAISLCQYGIHFCTKMEDCFRYYPVDPKYKMAEVEVIGDVLYSNEDSKCCTNKLRIVREISIQELLDNEESCLQIIKQDGWALQYVKKQTPEICLEAVKQNGFALEYVENQTSEICLEAVKTSGYALAYVKNQTPEICLEAVRQDGDALYYVEKQTPEICRAAIAQT